MRRLRVVRDFLAKELNGPFTRTITTGEEIAFMRWTGEEEHDRSAIFAVLVDGPQGLTPGPQYEAASEVFEQSTVPV